MASDSTNTTLANTIHTTSFCPTTSVCPKHTAHPHSTIATNPTGSRSQTLKHNRVNPPPKLSQHKSNYLPPTPPIHPPKQENQTTNSQPSALPTFRMIVLISRGSTLDFENKRQHRDYFRQVHCIVSEGPTKRTSGLTLRSPSPKKMSTSSATYTQMLLSSR